MTERRAAAPTRRAVDAALSGALAALAPIGLVAGWIALSGVSGLNYHLLPAATALAPAVAYRAARAGARASRRAAWLLALWGGAVSAGATLLLAWLGRPLDPAPAVAALIVAGAVGGAWWAARHGALGDA